LYSCWWFVVRIRSIRFRW